MAIQYKNYGPLTLPTGKVVTFRNTVGLDTYEILNDTPMSSEDYISKTRLVNRYATAKLLQTVDGAQVNGDYKHYFDTWDEIDVQYFTRVTDAMFVLSKGQQDQADEVAKNLLKGYGSTDGSTSTNTQTEPLASTNG